ncbi:hypothetical protein A8C32_13615 [Flavivirga aquatica]|uniref:HTH araC/xylS-type domain-containing protein n=1 Tax=Flavivirga aquatica TaxID=1849968 RepID=A0A1E5TC47_9FLAO|nr:AraC family transcriptional regulator [Flavivirga aquatica]OEK08942.1 hypothetical protein A8C32_13615 [Flavivirga aquatica]
MIYPIKNNERIITGLKNICIILSGNITIEKDGIITSVPSKSFFFFDTPFEIIAASPYIEGFVTKLDVNFLNTFSDLEKILEKIDTYFDFKKIKNLESKKNKIKSILDSESNLRLKESYLHILWSELLDDYIFSQKEQSTIEQFSELIEQNIQQNYCAGTYAEMLGIPLKSLIKEVKKSENKTPCNFITEKVIEKAKYKLLHTTDTSQMIAYHLGFEDPYYFIKYFKKNTELTPTQFRKQFSYKN